jgi:uncharacterized protein
MRVNLFMKNQWDAGVSLPMRWVGTVTCAGRTTCDRLALRWVTALFVASLLLGASGCAWLDLKQRQLIYRPTPGVPAGFAGLRAGDERYFVQVPQAGADRPAERIEMWWLPHADKSAPTLLYFHGTFRNLFQNLPKIEALRAAGFAVLAVEYRGWGLSTPITPSEQTILQDADLAWAELLRREPRAAQRVLYGHSMGSGVAVDVASRLRAKADYGALILESPLTSFNDVAREAGFFAGLLANFNNQRFASLSKITKVQAPVLMIHGSADTTIPIRVGETLFAAANAPKQWLPIEGGRHSDLHQVGAALYQAGLQRFANQYVLGR